MSVDILAIAKLTKNSMLTAAVYVAPRLNSVLRCGIKSIPRNKPLDDCSMIQSERRSPSFFEFLLLSTCMDMITQLADNNDMKMLNMSGNASGVSSKMLL
jgi:hypothetical protein